MMKTIRNDNGNGRNDSNDKSNDNGVSGNDAIRKIHFYLPKEQEHGHGHGHGHGLENADHNINSHGHHGHGHGHDHNQHNQHNHSHDFGNAQPAVTSPCPNPITPSPYYEHEDEDEDDCSEIIPRRLPVPLSVPANQHSQHSQHQMKMKIEEKEDMDMDMPEEPRMPLHLQLPPEQNEDNGHGYDYGYGNSHGQSFGDGQGQGQGQGNERIIENLDGRLATMNLSGVDPYTDTDTDTHKYTYRDRGDGRGGSSSSKQMHMKVQQQQYSTVEMVGDSTSSHEECEALRIENRQLRTILRDIGCSSLLPLRIHPNQGQNAMPSTMGDDASSSTYSSEVSQSWLKNMNMNKMNRNMHQQSKLMKSKTKTNSQAQMPLQMQTQVPMGQKINGRAPPQDGMVLNDQHANLNSISISISDANKNPDSNTSIIEENAKLHSEIQSLQQQLQYEQSQSQILQQNMNSIHIAKNELWSDLNHAMDDRKRFVLQCDSLQTEGLQSKKDMEDLRQLLHAKEDAIEKYKCEIQQLQHALGQRVEHIAKLEQQYDGTTQKIQSLQSTLVKHTQEKQTVTQEQCILQQHLSNSKLHIQELQLKLSQSEHDTQEYQNATRDVKKELEAMTQLYQEERARANLWGEQMKKLVRERAQMGTQLNLHEAHKRLLTPPSAGSSRRGGRCSTPGTGASAGAGAITGVYSSSSSGKVQKSEREMNIQIPASSTSTGGKFKQSTDMPVEREEIEKARRTNTSMKCSQPNSSFGSRRIQRRANAKDTASTPCKLSNPPAICMHMTTSTPSTKGTSMSEVGSTMTMAMTPTPKLEEKQWALEQSLQELERESPSVNNASYQPTICGRYLTKSTSASASNATSGLDVLSTCRKRALALSTSIQTSLEFSKENINPRAGENSKEHYASNDNRDHDHDLSLLDPPSALMKMKVPSDENNVGGDTVVTYLYHGSTLEDTNADAEINHLASVGDESLLDFLSQDDASTLI